MNRIPYLVVILGTLLLAAPLATIGAEQLTLKVTPPLFQLKIAPGEFWMSSLKVANSNPDDLTVFATAVNFEGAENGSGPKFLPLFEESEESRLATLAGWIEISTDPITVAKEKSVEIPFTIRVPEDAAPGSYYAAIIISTQPSENILIGSAISVSGAVTSILSLRILGEVREEGFIREFRTDKKRYERQEASFILRFENKGNVYLRPQGEITIYNMWGKERGKILIKEEKKRSLMVPPKSTEKFVFSWKGEGGFKEMGRHKAVSNLIYGKEARHSASSAAAFWVIPVIPLGWTIGVTAFFILAVMFLIRTYIRRAMSKL